MSGRQLYDLWVEANEQQNCGVESWDNMTDDDQETWNIMAGLLEVAIDARQV